MCEGVQHFSNYVKDKMGRFYDQFALGALPRPGSKNYPTKKLMARTQVMHLNTQLGLTVPSIDHPVHRSTCRKVAVLGRFAMAAASE